MRVRGPWGVRLDASGRQALLGSVGGDLRVMAGELEKLALYAGPGGDNL